MSQASRYALPCPGGRRGHRCSRAARSISAGIGVRLKKLGSVTRNDTRVGPETENETPRSHPSAHGDDGSGEWARRDSNARPLAPEADSERWPALIGAEIQQLSRYHRWLGRNGAEEQCYHHRYRGSPDVLAWPRMPPRCSRFPALARSQRRSNRLPLLHPLPLALQDGLSLLGDLSL